MSGYGFVDGPMREPDRRAAELELLKAGFRPAPEALTDEIAKHAETRRERDRLAAALIEVAVAPQTVCAYRHHPSCDCGGDKVRAALGPSRGGRNQVVLTERRAEFVYEAARLAAIGAQAPIVPSPWVERERAFKDQFLVVIERQCGEHRSRSPEELHGSWMQAYFAMGWIYADKYDREKKHHPDLVPYQELGQLERDKDSVFVALCEIARQWIYEPSAGEGGAK